MVFASLFSAILSVIQLELSLIAFILLLFVGVLALLITVGNIAHNIRDPDRHKTYTKAELAARSLKPSKKAD